MVVVVDFLDGRTGWYCVRAIGTGDGGHFVLSDFEQLLCDELADSTAGLWRQLI